LADGGYRIAWRVRAFFENTMELRQVFLDAATGAVLREYSDLRTQAAGLGTGVLGDKEKLSVSTGGAGYTTSDRLRPPLISTYDFRFDVNRLILFLNADGSPSNLTAADLGTDSDNVWTDGALVDAHVYAGFTYDYYYKRFGRHGLDDNNVAIHSVTHALNRDDYARWSLGTILTFFANAIYLGDGVMYYGDGLPSNVTLYGQHVNYMAGALDVVAHELTHGVTQYTSNLEYHDEPGALDEAFSDIMATGAEFYFQPGKADYLAGEDVFTPGGSRNLQNPMSYGYPDHYSVRYLGPDDNGGVHINSTIASHAFYLAIEGGRHRLGGTVQGVGAANRDQIEKVFYRGFTMYLTPTAKFSQARAATIQAARDLYSPASAAETAVIQAWNAVGVQ
jgi:thermolysin